MDNAEEWTKMKFYWEVVLGRVAGSKGWEEGDRHFTTISRAVFPHDSSGNKTLMDVSMEAFAVLLWESNHFRWTAQLKWHQEHPELNRIPKRVTANKHLDIFKAKYTSQDKGQAKFGGWSPEGLERYNVIYDDICASKYTDPKKPTQDTINEDWHAVEEAMLEKIRDELGISSSSKEGEKKRRKSNSNEVTEPIKEVEVRGMDF